MVMIDTDEFFNVTCRHDWDEGALEMALSSYKRGTSGTSAAAIQKVYAAIARSYSAEELKCAS
jgi:hypothetical protein